MNGFTNQLRSLVYRSGISGVAADEMTSQEAVLAVIEAVIERVENLEARAVIDDMPPEDG